MCTKLPGVVNELVPWVGDYIELVNLPPMKTIDKPEEASLPAFAEEIAKAIIGASNKQSVTNKSQLREEVKAKLSRFSWSGVFNRVERIWKSLV